MNQNLPCIKKIDVSECHLITDSGIASLAISKWDNLAELYLAGCSKITDTSLKLLKNCQTLEKLDIRNCASISEKACEKFIDSISNGHSISSDSENESEQYPRKVGKNNKKSKTSNQNKNSNQNGQNHRKGRWKLLNSRLFVKANN